jgi:hypothetical protein
VWSKNGRRLKKIDPGNFVLDYWLSGFRARFQMGDQPPLRREKIDGEFAV